MGSKKAKHKHIIKSILPGSIADELELEPGDELLSINDKPIIDILDYEYLLKDEEITILIKKQNDEEWELEIDKEYEDDLGIEFEDGLMDDYKSCKNKCIFCFIDQMPKGMRDTLYFKDDDARLSFLQGNYITLTNMTKEDIERVCFYKLSPINISVHTTNPELRCTMLNNRFAGEFLDKIALLQAANISMNAQVVLCKGFNDGKELDRTLADLERFLPEMQSLSVVPIGMTKFRDGLVKVEQFTKEDAVQVIRQISLWQQHFLYAHGTRFVHASDEWYIRAGLPIPDNECYEGYPQIENGVGMLRSLMDEFEEEFELLKTELKNSEHKNSEDQVTNKEGYTDCTENRNITIATGVLAAPYITEMAERLADIYPNLHVKVSTIINHFFGEEITVSGLLTGQDIIEQLKDANIGDELLLPENLLRTGESVLLDDITVNDMEKALQTRIRIVQSTGTSLIYAILGRN